MEIVYQNQIYDLNIVGTIRMVNQDCKKYQTRLGPKLVLGLNRFLLQSLNIHNGVEGTNDVGYETTILQYHLPLI